MSIRFCSQGFGTLEISNTDIPEEEILEGLESGDYLFAMFDGKIFSTIDGNLRHVADAEVVNNEFEHFDFERE